MNAPYPKKKILTVAVSSVVGVTPMANNAAPPIDYDQYTVNAAATKATISAVCPTGFTCSTTATDDGFLQRNLSDGTKNYVQLLISETKAEMKGVYDGHTALTHGQLEYIDESFIGVNGSNGAARKTRIAALSTTVTDINAAQFSFLSTDARLNDSFWTSTDIANGLSNEMITQVVSDAASTGTNATDFFVSFDFQQITTDAGAAVADVGEIMKTTQLVGDGAGGKAKMTHVDLSGSKLADYTSGSVTIGADTVDVLGGDKRMDMIWVGQDLQGTGDYAIQKATIYDNGMPTRVEGAKVDFAGTGFVGAAPQSGFSWDASLGTGIYSPNF